MSRLLFLISMLFVLAIQPIHAQSSGTFPSPDVTEPITTETASRLTVFKTDEDPVNINGLELNEAGNTLLVYSWRPYTLDLATNEMTPLPRPTGFEWFNVALSPDGTRVSQRLVSESFDEISLNLWDAQTGEVLVQLFTTPYTLVGEMHWTSENTLLFLTCENPNDDGSSCPGPLEYLQWDMDGNRLDNVPGVHSYPGTYYGLYTKDSSRLIQQRCQNNNFDECSVLIDVLDLVTGETVLTIDTDQIDTAYATKMSLSTDEKTIAVSVSEGNIQLFNLDTGENIRSVDAYDSDITALAFNPDGTLLASVGGVRYTLGEDNRFLFESVREDAYLRLWDTATGEMLAEIDVYKSKDANASPVDITSIVFTPDGRGLIFGGSRLFFAGVLNDAVCTIAVPGNANLRTLPTTSSERAGTLSAGQSVYAVGQAEGDDGFVWWLLLEGGWVRSDIVQAEERCNALPTTDG